jgi:hypothetical protein
MAVSIINSFHFLLYTTYTLSFINMEMITKQLKLQEYDSIPDRIMWCNIVEFEDTF